MAPATLRFHARKTQCLHIFGSKGSQQLYIRSSYVSSSKPQPYFLITIVTSPHFIFTSSPINSSIMKLLSRVLAGILTISVPALAAKSLPRAPFAFPNSTSPNTTISPNATIPRCPLTNTTFTSLDYKFALRAISDHKNDSISLVNSPALASTWHISNLAKNLGVFILAPDGHLLGAKAGHTELVGNCTLLRSGSGNLAVDIPSCAYNASVSSLPVSNRKWMARSVCVDGTSKLILLPDFGNGTAVKDTYFHAVPGAEPLIFHAQIEVYPTAFLVIDRLID
ncbi:hypothetical protein BDZ45DRAFT_776854 [Acephala macrosclerotiorum]|nr:hypothetical protein BDZ45DRAFT_776854 [Acephala macrosclerotiorum]